MESNFMDRFPHLLNETYASQMLGVSVGALRRWRREGRGPQFTRIERCIRYDVRDLERFVAINSSSNRSAARVKMSAGPEVR